MEKRKAYYVSNKSVLTWISALIMICSAMARIVSGCGEGTARGAVMWFQILLPTMASVIFALMLLLGGKERLYRTTIPVGIFCLCFAVMAYVLGFRLRFVFLQWFVYLAVIVIYNRIITGRTQNDWALLLLFGIGFCWFGYEHAADLRSGEWGRLLQASPNLLLTLGGIFMVFAMREYPRNGQYHPTWGDRPDGRRIRTLPAMASVSPYIMPNRNGASNLLRDSIEISAMERYVREKRKEGLHNFGLTHVLLAAYVRCVAQYPQINRFLSGQKVYSRDDDIQFCMIVKTEMTVEAPDTAIKLHLKPSDTVYEVYEKFNTAVEEVKKGELDSDFDNTAKIFTYLPGIMLKFAVWVLKVMDYFGLIPKFLLEVSPFHGSIFFTSMGSLGIPPVFHHLYDFGNLPVFCAFGCKRRENEITATGDVISKKYMDYTFVTDERICDGFYFATVLKYLKKILAHPERLDLAPDEIVKDID